MIARAGRKRRSDEERFWSKVDTSGECWLWTGATRDRRGYGCIRIVGRGAVGAHRYSYEITFGPIAKGLMVCHRCDTPRCVRPDHLFLGTAAENTADMVAKGRARGVPGERHPHAKLTDAQVSEIRRRTAAGESARDLAHEFGVHSRYVSALTANRSRRKTAGGTPA